ncbi:hypothetical protein MKEN_00088800 [Mycena kentingensis (nom. inval.)]|nr:hypothetical protein MKEN_00088800 [Mycena kentingensis (nom. inval.)]
MRCPVCRSKQWHKEPSSGLIACSEGHILQNYRNETTEMEDAPRHQMKKRAIKAQKRAMNKRGLDSKLYHGSQGRYLYFQCLQLVLRHQVTALVERWTLPTEFEAACRDIWTLHLSLLRDPIPEDDSDGENPDAAVDSQPAPADPANIPPIATLSDEESDNEEANNAQIDQLLAENSETESEDEPREGARPVESRAKTRHQKHELAVNTLAILIIACWTLRIPILYCDLLYLVESYELPCLDSLRILPQNMVAHLNRYNIQALSPLNAPNPVVLHELVSSLARRIHDSYGILTPEVNAAPILWRVVCHCFGGTPTLYNLVKRVAARLSLPLTLHHSLAPSLKRVKSGDPEHHIHDNVPPEHAFAAASVIVLKWVYGLDGKPRVPATTDDPACDMPRIEEYLALLQQLNTADDRAREAAFSPRREMPIEELDDARIDEYLAFCERALLAGGSDELLDRYFTLDTRPSGAWQEVGGLQRKGLGATRRQIGGSGKLLPGEEYGVGEGAEEIILRGCGFLGVKVEYLRWLVTRDKEQPRPDPRRAHIVLTPLPTTPVLSSSSEHASSASSNGSTSIQTPDHDNEPDLVLSRTPTKRSWSTWLSRSKGTIKRTQRPPIPAPDEDWVDATPWRPTEAPILKPPPPPKSLLPAAADDSDEDASDSESEHDVDDDESPAVAPPSTSVAESSNYLECLILNARHIPVWTCSPFARPDGAPMYPRSSNSPRSLPVRDTMQTAIHKTLLLRRLRDTDVLTRAAQDSILPFASRHPPTLLDPPSLPWFHASAPPKTMKITETSPGLRTWFARRCFEERFAVWLPTPNGGVALRPVDSSAAVAELEYSAAIEAMIGLEPSPVADPPTVVVPPVAKNAQPPAAPSPLRNSALKPSVPPPVSPTESNASAPAVPHTTSRVRFAEDDKEDVIPLGYVLRLKKRREEKARFLREEQERRAFEEERTRQEDERRRRELERRQWEEEKRAWEREKRAIEEGRKKRLYAEEVAATRARREYQRAGGSYGVGNSMLASSSTTSLRDERHRSESGKISRPVHDQRRQASEPAVPQYGSTPSSSPHTSSPLQLTTSKHSPGRERRTWIFSTAIGPFRRL